MNVSAIGYQPKVVLNNSQSKQNINFQAVRPKMTDKAVGKGAVLTAGALATLVEALYSSKIKTAALQKNTDIVEDTAFETKYGPIEHIKYKDKNGKIRSKLIVSRPNGMTMDIFKDIPQEILESLVAEHISQVKCSTINPKVGIVITQNQSKPVIARKITVDGTLENCMVENNSNDIPLKFDILIKRMFADTPWNPGKQIITGRCLQVTYGTVKESYGARHEYVEEYGDPKTGEAPDVGTLAAQKGTEDRSFMPADIAGKQYEIVLENGERIPCNYEDMVAGAEYKISKKAGVELKMAVPLTDVISSEGESLKAGVLYMVDSNGHFYNGQPIKRIKSGEVTWKADMNDPVQAQIRNHIDEAIKLEAEAKAIKAETNKLNEQADALRAQTEEGINGTSRALELNKEADTLEAKAKEMKARADEINIQAKTVTSMAEKEMTAWVIANQNPEGLDFFESMEL